jgi:hypothetical protein
VPNHPLQQTAAAILVPRDIKALSAAAAAELCRSANAQAQLPARPTGTHKKRVATGISAKGGVVASVVNTISITGPVGPVFDLVTSARFWPQWHPASRAVGGVIQRPYQLGDVIHERAQFAGKDFQFSWKVVEHLRPARVVLQAQTSPSRITYSFEARGEEVVFCRELVYDEAQVRQLLPEIDELGRQVHAQSEEGLSRLKALVEATLRAETVGL